AGPDVKLELAGGLAEEGALGTDAVRVAEAIGRADSGDGVLVLMDLGSAVLSAETALDFLAPEQREHVLLCEAPLVEGAVAAAVAARVGEPLAKVAADARGGRPAPAARATGFSSRRTARRRGPRWQRSRSSRSATSTSRRYRPPHRRRRFPLLSRATGTR